MAVRGAGQANRLALAAALVSSVLLVLSASAGGGVAANADLAVTSVEGFGLGDPPHLVIRGHGLVQRFGIAVTITNRSATSAAPPTKVNVTLDTGEELAIPGQVTLPAIPPHDSRTKVVVFENAKLPLGITHVTAKADGRNAISEPNEANNTKRGPDIAVLAPAWAVADLSNSGKFGPQKLYTRAKNGFVFKFADGDPASEEFVYKAFGEVETTATTDLGICKGQAKATKQGFPWPHGFLRLKAKLTGYQIQVDSSTPSTYDLTVRCPQGRTFPEKFGIQDLLTAGERSMQPTDDALKGEATLIQDKLNWSLVADVH
jgi:hypothetical protein